VGNIANEDCRTLNKLTRTQGGIPFIGYGAEQFKRPPSPKLYTWLTTIANDGLLRYPGILGSYRLIPSSPKVLSELLVTKSYDFQKPEQGRTILRLALGDGLVVAEGDLHRFQRKSVNPMFSFRHIRDLYPLMFSKAVELTKCINSEIYTSGNADAGTVIEISQWASRATLDIIGVAALGREFNTLHNTDDELVQLYEWMFQPDSERLMWFAINLLIPRKIVGLLPWKIETETVGKAIALRKVCRQLLKNKRDGLKQEAVESVDTLAHLIRSNNFSDHELVDQLLTFLAAG
jgi:cytochrome P450